MVKNIYFIIYIIAVLAIFFLFRPINVKSNDDFEEKAKCNASIEENFASNRVLVVLNKEDVQLYFNELIDDEWFGSWNEWYLWCYY